MSRGGTGRASARPWGTPLPGSRKGLRPAPVRTVYLRVGGEVVEGEAHAFPYHFQKEPRGVWEGSLDV